METLDSLILLGLLIYGIASARSKRKKRKARIHQGPPPLPPRSSPGPGASATAAAKPPRAGKQSRGRLTRPRGLSPLQFPCCPFDKQRNLPHAPQKIFFDSAQNCITVPTATGLKPMANHSNFCIQKHYLKDTHCYEFCFIQSR